MRGRQNSMPAPAPKALQGRGDGTLRNCSSADMYVHTLPQTSYIPNKWTRHIETEAPCRFYPLSPVGRVHTYIINCAPLYVCTKLLWLATGLLTGDGDGTTKRSYVSYFITTPSRVVCSKKNPFGHCLLF